MGLDTTHGAFNGPYSSFMRFRIFISKFYDLPKELDEIYSKSKLALTDGIYALLNHSDCDGKLTPKECNLIMHELNELISNVKSFTSQLEEFSEGCKKAHESNEDLEFK